MSDFYTKMKQTQANISKTENGMIGYKTTYHPLLDMNFKLPSYRGDKIALNRDLEAVMKSGDAEYILKFLFYLRDVREGLGERDTFREALRYIIAYDFENKDEIIKKFINEDVQEYGRFDDIIHIFIGTPYANVVIDKIRTQLNDDFVNMKDGKSISLLAKWLPSENTSSPSTRMFAKKIIKSLGATSKEYRKLLSALRAYLKVTEVNASANKWGDIDYNTVPSKANLKYKNAFLKHDEERRRDYLAALRVGVDKNGKTVKINSSVNYPHDIVHKYSAGRNWWGYKLNEYDEATEQLWRNLKQMPGLDNTIVVRDGSGSMLTTLPNSNVLALEVSTALAIYCAERLQGDFANKFVTFSSDARLVELTGSTLQGKLSQIFHYDDCSNTNIENVFTLILNTARHHGMSQEDMPKQVLIISDMEFDASRFRAGANVFDNMAQLYQSFGYELPKLVFWNVNGRSNTIPTLQSKNGVILVSGFSVNILSMITSGKTDPFEALVDKLNVERYANIPLLKLCDKVEVDKSEVKVAKTPKGKREKKVIEKPNWL